MKKSILTAIIAIIILAALVGGGFALFHKSSKNSSTSNSGQSNAPAVNNAVLITKTASGIGQYLADPSGRALYTYNADTSGVSTCTGSCLAVWPAYQDTGSTTNLPSGVGTIKRTDNGQIQYTYLGMPLYYFASDSQGQVTGNGVQNFSVAKPSAASAPSTSTQSTPSTTPSQSNSNSSPSYTY